MTLKHEFHEVADLFPLMEEQPLAELAADIAANGLHEPIWRHNDGRIIDGRNRWRACQLAGVECRHRTYEKADDTIVAWVVSKNLHRRHLTTKQRAAIAADLATMTVGRPGKIASNDAITDAAAAKLLNVSEPSVERAKALKRADPEAHEKVKSGQMTVSTARKKAAAELGGGTAKRGTSKMVKGIGLRVAFDRDDGLVEQVFGLISRLQDVSAKISPDALHARVEDRLMHNISRSIEQSTEFLIGLRDVHRAWAAEKKNAAV